MEFRNIYELENKNAAKDKFNSWITNIFTNQRKEFYTAANSVKVNIDNILNFFCNRSNNANAESFNSKIKLFRTNLRSVTDTTFSCSDYINFLLNPQEINVTLGFLYFCLTIYTEFE